MSTKITFIDPPAAIEYDCGICLGKLNKPVYIGCGSHFFCHQCIMDLVSHHHNNKFPCPNCRKLCHTKHINRMPWIDRRMDQLQVRCPNFEITVKKAHMLHNAKKCKIKREKCTHRSRPLTRNHNKSRSNSPQSRSRSRERNASEHNLKHESTDTGSDIVEFCEWVGEWSNLSKHKRECPYHVIKCQYCRALLIRKDTNTHFDECVLYPITCEQCETPNIARNQLRHHQLTICENGQIHCHKCNERMLRKDLERHRKGCPEMKVRCEYSSVGCKEVIKRKDFERHNQEKCVFHLELVNSSLISRNSALERDMNGLERENGALRNRLDGYEQRLSEMEQRMGYASDVSNGGSIEEIESEQSQSEESEVSEEDVDLSQSGSEEESQSEEQPLSSSDESEGMDDVSDGRGRFINFV